MAVRLVTSLLAAILLSAGAAAEEMADNPQYATWAKHKPGTQVVMAMKTSAGGSEMTMQMTQKLTQVADDKVTLDISTKIEMPGMPQREGQKKKQSIPKKVPAEQARTNLPPGVKGTASEVGTETIDAAGKSYECKVIEFTGEREGMQAKGKLWRNEQVPGGVVKMETTGEGKGQAATVTMTLISVDLK